MSCTLANNSWIKWIPFMVDVWVFCWKKIMFKNPLQFKVSKAAKEKPNLVEKIYLMMFHPTDKQSTWKRLCQCNIKFTMENCYVGKSEMFTSLIENFYIELPFHQSMGNSFILMNRLCQKGIYFDLIKWNVTKRDYLHWR